MLVGETTFGKGKVQQVVDLKDGSMVKYTSAYWRTPKNICIDKVGITPDYQVLNEAAKDANGNLMITKDNQLEKAISLLKQ